MLVEVLLWSRCFDVSLGVISAWGLLVGRLVVVAGWVVYR